MNKEFNTESWTMSISMNPGYDPAVQREMEEEKFAEIYLACAEKTYQETGVYISAALQRNRMLYRQEWGCPANGEQCFELRGTRNPLFAEKDAYKAALIKLVEMLKEKMKQNAIWLEIQDVQLKYFVNEC